MIEKLAAEAVKNKVEKAVEESLKDNQFDTNNFEIDEFLKTKADDNNREAENQAESKDSIEKSEDSSSSVNDSSTETESQPELINVTDQTEKPYEVIKTNNDDKEGQEYKGVPFVRKKVDLGDRIVEGVFPVFESLKDVQLPPDKYKSSDDTQGRYCTEQLRDAINKDPALAKQFTPRQLEAIKDGKAKIPGLTWHHNENLGKMQLVDSAKHAAVGHTGGGCLWAGRNEK